MDDTVEPITLVEVADISNVSDATPDGSPAHEDFTDIVATMGQGESYDIALEGNTVGDFTNHFTVFIDWNQNEILDDTGEIYEIGSITNSTGEDGQQAAGTIDVPVDAMLGETRMRVYKNFNTSITDPCTDTDWGQVEDYTVNVEETAGIDENELSGFAFYPNPSNDIINLVSETIIDNVVIYNMLGQQVMDKNIGATDSQLNISNLATGAYLLQVVSEGQTGTYQLMKK